MIQDVLSRLLEFVASVPINLVIVGVICLVLLMFRTAFSIVWRVAVSYLLLCFIFSLLGWSMPSIPQIIVWCKTMFLQIWNWVNSLGIF